jgi:hypothetical protein
MNDPSNPDVIRFFARGRMVAIPRNMLPAADKVALDTAVEAMQNDSGSVAGLASLLVTLVGLLVGSGDAEAPSPGSLSEILFVPTTRVPLRSRWC